MWRLLLAFITSLVDSLRDKYNGLKIRHKLFLVNLAIAAVVCIISILTFQITLLIYQEILYNQAAKELNFFVSNIEKELEQIERYSYEIITDTEIQTILSRFKDRLGSTTATLSATRLSDKLWTYVFERNIVSVSIIDTNGQQYSGGMTIQANILPEIIKKAKDRMGAIVFIEPIDDFAVICARQIRKIQDLSLESLGTLVIKINTPSLIQQCSAGYFNDSVDLLIISDNSLVFSSGTLSEAIGAEFKLKDQHDYQIVTYNKKRYFASRLKSNYTQWTYISILPYQLIFYQISILKGIILLSFVFILGITSYLGAKFANSLTKPIEKLSNQMQVVQSGNFSIDKKDEKAYNRTDEIGNLEKNFITMVDKINNLIYENYTRQLLIKNAELTALRANINPHFLYNTLESINWLAKTNKQTEISQMVESLGRLLRNAISQKDHLATLSEEIGLLNDYITIQRMRFGDRLNFRLDIPKKWHNYRIPRLSLQPIVENSITYGLEKMADVCKISVTAREDGDNLLIIVEDNGPGITVENLERLRRWQHEPNGLGVGLKNIDDRLKIIYGNQYGLEIMSDYGVGTTVILRLPLPEGKYVQDIAH